MYLRVFLHTPKSHTQNKLTIEWLYRGYTMLQRQRAPFSLAPAFLGTGFPFSTPRSPWPPKLSRNHPASLPRIPRQPHPNDQKATPRPTTPPHTPKKEPQNKGRTHNQLFWGMYFFPHGMLCFPGPGEIEEIWGMYSAAPVGFCPGFLSTGLKIRNLGHHLGVVLPTLLLPSRG